MSVTTESELAEAVRGLYRPGKRATLQTKIAFRQRQLAKVSAHKCAECGQLGHWEAACEARLAKLDSGPSSIPGHPHTNLTQSNTKEESK